MPTEPSRSTMLRRDEVWLRQLYQDQWVPMVRMATLLTGSAESAEEMAVEGLVAAHLRRDHFEHPDQARAYLRSAVVSRTRAANRHRVVADRQTTSRGRLPSRDPRDEVLAVLEALPQRQREVLVLRDFLDLDDEDIAETLRISESAVAAHAHRGMHAVRAAVDPEGGAHG